ncbi:MAG: hypothetical protein P9L95_10700 [Candidatus Tenebribacter mawsonii]|nr:hypothetical protein [Candidatus Tenebribacter mawsonii]
MNNALRITLIVFVLLLLVLVGGTLYKNQNQKKITAMTQSITDLDKKIQKISEEFAQSIELKKELARVKEQVDKFEKSISKYDSPPITYDYLLNILDMMKDDLIFNFTYSGQKQDAGMMLNSYLIKGSASLNQVYQLVSQLEKQKTIYYIYNLAITAPEITASDTINYSFMVDSISENAVPQKVDHKLKKISINHKVGRLFTCGLLEEKRAAEKAIRERNFGLINLNNLSLIAVRGDEAIFHDSQGILHVLISGDKVKDGLLTEIDEENGIVKFMMNMGNGKKEERVYNIGSGGKQ